MKIVKLSDEQLALVGATTAAEFAEKLTAHFAGSESQITTTMPDNTELLAATNRITVLERDLALLVPRLTALEARPTLNAETVQTVAKAEASRVTTEALAAIGTTHVKPTPAPADANETPAAKAAALIKAGKFEEAFEANAELREEFANAKVFAAYCRASRRGAIKINQKEKSAARN